MSAHVTFTWCGIRQQIKTIKNWANLKKWLWKSSVCLLHCYCIAQCHFIVWGVRYLFRILTRNFETATMRQKTLPQFGGRSRTFLIAVIKIIKKWPDLLFQGRPKSPWKPISQSVVCHIWGHTTKVTIGQVWHDKSISICVHVCFLSFWASVLSMNLLYLKLYIRFGPFHTLIH